MANLTQLDDESSHDGDDSEGDLIKMDSRIVQDGGNVWVIEFDQDAYGAVARSAIRLANGDRRRDLIGPICCVLLTIYIQFSLAFAFLPEISKDEYKEKYEMDPDEFPEGNLFYDWRLDYTAGSQIAGGGKTWAQWACEGGSWDWQQTQIENFQKYNAPFVITCPGFRMGTAFGAIALFLWGATTMKEIRKAIGMGLPLLLDEEKHKLCQAPWLKSVIFSMLVIRLTLCFGTCYHGTRFLAFTDNLKDFILNSLALSFVYEIPALIFEAFAPANDKRDFNKMWAEGYQAKVTVSHCFNFFSGVMPVALAFSLVGFGVRDLLLPFGNNLVYQVLEELCRTNTSDAWDGTTWPT